MQVSKTFQKDGHWVERPHKTVVLVCSCGEKYIKTREPQTMCLKCTSDAKDLAKAQK